LTLERAEQWAEAEELYDNILEQDKVNTGAWKRKICIYKAQGDRAKAVTELVAYLTIFASDAEAWLELAELYIILAKFELAKFCYEELILMQPENYLYHLQYAELLCTLGSKRNSLSFELAVYHYTQSLDLKPIGNLRAMFGLLMALRSKTGSKDAGLDSKLYATAFQKIREVYCEANCQQSLNVLEEIFNPALVQENVEETVS